MNQLTLTSASQMGEPHPTYGTAYWCDTLEKDMPVMFNTKADRVSSDARITYEESEQKQGKKGPFLRLKGVKIQNPEGSAPTMESGTVTLETINNKLDIILESIGEKPDQTEQPPAEAHSEPTPKELGQTDDEPVSLSDIPFN